MAISVGTYQWYGFKTCTRKDANNIKKRILKHQPFLYQVDLYLIKNTRETRKILRRLKNGR